MTPAKRPIGPPGVPEGSGRASLLFPGRSLDRRGASGGTAPQEAPRLRRHRASGGTAQPLSGRPQGEETPPAPTPTGKPVCFYSARRVSASVSADRLVTMEQKIQGEIRSQLEMARPARPDHFPFP